MPPKKAKLRMHDITKQTRLNVRPDEDVQYVMDKVIALAKSPISSINEALEKFQSHPLREDPTNSETRYLIADIIEILELIKSKRK